MARDLPFAKRMARALGRTGPSWPPRRVALSAPDPQPGQQLGPPDFVGIGAQRAGTSWLHSLLTSHPQVEVHPSVPKEIHFFDRHYETVCTEADIARYHSLFPRRRGRLAGEWTPEYMVWPWVPPLLAEAGVRKLLVTLRDPVERYAAGWSFSVRRGAPDVPTISGDAFHRGFYHRQLSWVLAHFDRSQLCVLQYERCLDDPAGAAARMYEFLGLEEFDPPTPAARVKAAHDKLSMPHAVRTMLTDAYRDDVKALVTAFPEIDVARWPNFTPDSR